MATILRTEQTEAKVLGSGTVIAGVYTLTVPATGTAALLDQAQTFTTAQLVNYVTTDGTTIGLRSKTDHTVTTSGARYATALQVDGTIVIGTGAVSTGYFAAAYYAPMRSTSSDKGTLATLYGLLFNYGHASTVDTAAITTNAYGIYLAGRYQQGTVVNLYDVYIAAPATGGTAPTNIYSLYIANTAHSYHAGNLLLGTLTDGMTAGGSLAINKDLAHRGSLVGFYNVTPIARPTTASSAAAFTANSGTAVNDASTFDGYTLKQVVKALRNFGLLT